MNCMSSSFLMVVVVNFLTNSAAFCDDDPQISMVFETTDKRQFDSDLYKRAISSSNIERIRVSARSLGRIGGAEVVPILTPLLNHADLSVQIEAVHAIGISAVHDMFDLLHKRLSDPMPLALKDATFRAMGRLAEGDDWKVLNAYVVSDLSEGLIDGLIQALAYTRLPALELGQPTLRDLAQAIKQGGITSDASAYLLTRLTTVPAAIAYVDFDALFHRALTEDAYANLMRVAPQYGNDARLLIMNAVMGPAMSQRVKFEAFAGLHKISIDPAASPEADTGRFEFLKQIINQHSRPDGQMMIMRSAVAALGRGALRRDDKTVFLAGLVSSGKTDWVKAAALEGLKANDKASAYKVALKLLESKSPYLRVKAIGVLGDHEDAKLLLGAYVNDPVAYVSNAAKTALKIENEAANLGTRDTVAYEVVLKSAAKTIRLYTSQGEIEFSLLDAAAYAAHNFVTLAEQGLMNGMLWHRVINNFVTQAGEYNDGKLAETGTIRAEWTHPHKEGTLGVATNGKDTGSNQFFINTRYNRHLNDRYTVFGYVTKGMDVVHLLGEGDIIKRAKILD